MQSTKSNARQTSSRNYTATYVPQILLADDNRDDHLMFMMAAEEASVAADLQFAKNGTEVLRRLTRTESLLDLPDLIVLDLRMPYMDGHRTLAALKNDSFYADIPVAILTSSSSEEDRRRSEDLGAEVFTTKPSTFQAMVELATQLESLALSKNAGSPNVMETWIY